MIGGGVIGGAIALRLAQARLRVAVIDRGEPGGEASSAAAGMIAPQGEATGFGAFFELCQASRDLYPSLVAELEELTGVSLGYRSEGAILVSVDGGQQAELDEVYRAQASHGLAIGRLTPEDLHRRVPGLSPHLTGGLFIAGDHWLDSERLATALVEAGRHQGVAFHTHTVATRLIVRDERLESVEIRANQGTSPATTVSAGSFILAAGCWSGELAATLGITLPMQPCRGQMIEFDAPTGIPLVVRAGHHYLVPRGRCLLVGTTAEYIGFEKAVTGEGLRSILEGVERFAPLVKTLHFRRAWAGLRPDTVDHLPILGFGSIRDLVFATGHFRNGILLAPITARLVAELVLTGSTSIPLDPYDPRRSNRS